MRTVVLSLFLVLMCLTCAACGGSRQAFGVQEVERVFAEHGLPFAGAITNAKPNPYLKPSQPSVFAGLPKLEARELNSHLLAYLAAANPRTFSNRMAYVFDSSASFRLARRLVPGWFKDRPGHRTVTKNSTSETGCAIHRENVFVQASYDECSRIRVILADLH